MRFYFFDGTSAKGPYSAEEVAALPGFDAESVVCPVGSQNREDWKPAIAYEPLKNLLFKPLPLPTLALPRAPTQPCPKCSHRNELEAVFCNRCGSRMSEETAAPPSQEPAMPAPSIIEPPTTAAAPAPAAAAPAIMEPQYPRLALPVLPPLPVERPWKTYIAAGAAVLAAFYIFFVWLPKRKPAAQKAAPPAAKAAPAPTATPVTAAPATPPALAPAPAAPKPAAAPAARQPSEQRRRRAEALAQPKQKPQAPAPAPILQNLAPEPANAAPKPQAQEAAPPPRAAEGILLPGMPSKIQRPSSPPSTDAEKLSLENVREQFDFCHQLMRQQAHSDVFDTCLCPNARKAAPFNGSKDIYVRLAQEAAQADAGKTRPSFEIVSAKLQDANTAAITAVWKSGKKDKGRETTETWLLEDGLWCLQP